MQYDLTQGDIKKHIRMLAVPASIGFFFHTMFNITDTWFAGLISTEALAALTLSFPIFFLIISIAGGMSEAVTALVGNALGEGKRESAQHIMKNALLFAGMLAIVLTTLGYLFTPFLMRQLGAEGSYLYEAVAYITIIVSGTVLFVFSFFINAMLNAQGDTVSFRNILVVSALLNVVLDYWFIMGGWGVDPMGVEGIALATVLIEGITVFYLWFRLGRTPLMRETVPFRYDPAMIAEVMRQGVPPSLNMALTAIGIYIITYYAAPFGQEVVAAFGIGMRVEQILLMPAIGLNVAVLALAAQNHGARFHHRIVETVDVALGYGALLAFFGGGILLGSADIVMELFSDNRDVIVEGAVYLRIEALIIYPFVVIFTYLAMLQGIKRPGFIFYISIARQVVLPIAVLSLLAWLDYGVVSIWVGIAAIVTLSAIITRWYSRRELDRVEHLHGLVRLDTLELEEEQEVASRSS
jgi:putative MATE family efflux protein